MIKRQRKLNIFRLILVLSLMFIFVSTIGHVFASAFSANTPVPAAKIVVKSGDTLWSIAENYVTPNDDIRELIYEIQKVNHLAPNSSIIPGQALIIPQKYCHRGFLFF